MFDIYRLMYNKSSNASQLFNTGSVNMVLRCDANARNARDWKMAMFKLEYIVFIVGIRITAITTNSA